MRVVFTLFIMASIGFVGESRAAEDEDVALVHFETGVTRFDDKDYQGALDAFLQAYAANPSWKLLYNIGHCQAALKQFGVAVESFERYLAMGGDDISAHRKEEVIGELDQLRKMIGDLEIVTDGVYDIYVDGVRRGQTPLPGNVPVTAGVVHHIELKDDGAVVFEDRRTVRGGTVATVEYGGKEGAVSDSDEHVDGEAEGDEVVPADEPKIVVGPVDSRRSTPLSPGFFWGAAGTAVALGGTTIAVAAYVGAHNDSVDSQAEADRLNRVRRVGVGTLVGTIASAAAAGVLAVFTDFGAHSKRVSVLPSVFVGERGESGVLLHGTF